MSVVYLLNINSSYGSPKDNNFSSFVERKKKKKKKKKKREKKIKVNV